QDPTNPMLLWDDGTGGGHDAAVIGNRLVDFHGGSGTNIYDVSFSNPFSVQLLGSINDPAISYHHSGWTTENGRYLFICDELATHPTADITVWDINDPGNPQKVDELADPTATVHNLYVLGDFAYASYYSAGFRVFDVSIPNAVVMVGEYDTSPSSGEGFQGAWGVYPFAPSGNVYVSDRQNGLFVFQFNGAHAYRIQGTLKDSITGIGIENGWIEILQSGVVERSDSSGNFRIASAAGVITLRAAAFGYERREMQLTAIPGMTDTLEINLQPADVSAISGTITNRSGNPIEGLSLRLLVNSAMLDDPVELQTATDVNGQYVFDSLFVSDSVWVNYERLTLEQLFPYASTHVESLTVASGSPSVLDFQLDPADILLVNDDPNASYMSIYQDPLATLGITPFEWTTTADGDAIPVSSINQLNHDLIVWFTGDAVSDVLTTTEQDSLALFLNNGGQLFLTGKNIANSLDGQASPFLTDYLEVDFGGTNVGATFISPVSSNPMSGGLSSFLVIQSSSDIVDPITGGIADSAFTYGNGSPAGVTIHNPTNNSKIAFIGFGFENIQSSVARVDLMAAAMDWFGVITSVESVNSVPNALLLKQNYPNPFNPSTIIEFSLPQAGYTTLKVYDVLGREIASLVADDLSAGIYTVTWNAGDVASGVYFYRLSVVPAGTPALIPGNRDGKTGVLTVSKKLLLLK
ncbi:MAG: choice-of-anchor B family protein, partial [Ignavibacteria bacterium]|nr:choice-of-anchor B family protein [Ignavibacteria bacterium]